MTAQGRVLDALERLENAATLLAWRSVLPVFQELRVQARSNPSGAVERILKIYDTRIDLVFEPREGHQYLDPGPFRDAAFEFAAQRGELYWAAIALWLELTPPSNEVELKAINQDFASVVTRDGRYFVRYDCGSHGEIWREDEISLEQVRQAALGRMHLNNMILGLQNDMTANGIDWSSSNFKPTFES